MGRIRVGNLKKTTSMVTVVAIAAMLVSKLRLYSWRFSMISGKTITTGMISVILLAIVVTNSVNAQTYTREPYSETVANSPFTIYAGKNTQFSFTVPSDAVNVY